MLKFVLPSILAFAIAFPCSMLCQAADQEPVDALTVDKLVENREGLSSSPIIKSDELWSEIENGRIKMVKNGWENFEIQFYIKTLDELEEESSDIVAGTFLDDSREDKIIAGNDVLYGCTITSFKISKVYKGELSAGDIIPLGEEYYTESDGYGSGGLQLVYSAEYLPHKLGQEYLFFLTKTPETNDRFAGVYASTQFERGRYPILSASSRNTDISAISNDALGIGDGPSNAYKNIFGEVVKKYM